MKCVVQQTATWDEATAKQIVESVINSGEKFNVSMPKMTVWQKRSAALDELVSPTAPMEMSSL